MRYLPFIARNWRFLGFGFLLALASSFGQTFFIALFGREIRAAFELTHGSFGTLYSAATLLSGLTLLWAGAAVDRFDLRRVSTAVSIGLVAACAAMALSPAAWVLVVAIFGLRFTGQGLLSHVSATAMARYHAGGPGGSRGKALAIANLGHPAGEALLPAATVAVAAAIGWRSTWAAIAAVTAVTVVPATLWLLRGHGERHRAMLDRAEREGEGEIGRPWRRREVLRDSRFYLMLPAILAAPFINTGVFFHQAYLVEVKGWSLGYFASAFTVYAVATVASAIASGHLVDRTGAVRLAPAFLPPLTVGLAAMAWTSHPAVAVVYMALAGLTQGAANAIVQSMLAERYGVRHLGAIRALLQALMVLSTSLAPASLGALIDAGTALPTMFAALAGYTGIAAALAAAGARSGPSRT